MMDILSRGVPHPSNKALRDFVKGISDRFCPFIASAQKNEVLSFSEYSCEEVLDIGKGKISAGMFYLGVIHSEHLRARRRRLLAEGKMAAASLVCSNVVVVGTEGFAAEDAKRILDWPHYLLKVIYSEAALMFGKFWTQESVTSLNGRDIPTTPGTFLSIRSSVRRRDPLLLRDQFSFSKEILNADDGGQDVLLRKAGIEGRRVSVEALAESKCYESLKGSLDG